MVVLELIVCATVETPAVNVKVVQSYIFKNLILLDERMVFPLPTILKVLPGKKLCGVSTVTVAIPASGVKV